MSQVIWFLIGNMSTEHSLKYLMYELSVWQILSGCKMTIKLLKILLKVPRVPLFAVIGFHSFVKSSSLMSQYGSKKKRWLQVKYFPPNWFESQALTQLLWLCNLFHERKLNSNDKDRWLSYSQNLKHLSGIDWLTFIEHLLCTRHCAKHCIC